MEWNFTYCFIHRLFDDESKINIYHLNNIEKTKHDIRRRILVISLFNFIFMPFILIFILFSNLFEYGVHFITSRARLLVTIGQDMENGELEITMSYIITSINVLRNPRNLVLNTHNNFQINY